MSETQTTADDSQTTICFGCGSTIHIRDDEWWSHSWNEEPAKEKVVESIEEPEFRDWFRETKMLCPDCHKRVIGELQSIREANNMNERGDSDA